MSVLLAALATWRLSSLLVYEEGPLETFNHIRDLPPLRKLLACFWCTSVWVAASLAGLIVHSWTEWFITWLALSAVAVLIEEFRCRR